MLHRSTAFAAMIVLAVAAPVPAADDLLTLDEAMTRVIAHHPDLLVYRHTVMSLAATADRAAQSPALRVAADIENALGSGSAAALNGAELTLSLASVLERGGKRDARRALAASHIDALGLQRASTRLDVIAEVARRYLDLAAAQAQQGIAAVDFEQRERSVIAAAKRVQAGAAPESVQLTAEAMRARATLDQMRARAEASAAWQRLQLLWGEAAATPVPRMTGIVLNIPETGDYAALAALLEQSPELEQFADRRRLGEAQLQLARSAASTDVEWRIGLRRLEADNDWGVVAGISLPLGTSLRAAPDIRGAEASIAALDLERTSALLTLASTLAEAHGKILAAQIEVAAIRDDLLPRLKRAEAAAERAYRAGAQSYMEWAAIQSETISVQRQQLAAAVDAHRALIEIQRLTAEPIVPGTATARDTAP